MKCLIAILLFVPSVLMARDIVVDVEAQRSKSGNFTIKEWGNEVSFSVLPDLIGTPQRDISTNTVNGITTLVTPSANYRYFDLPISTDNPEGGFEFEVILKTPPSSNIVTLPIQTSGLDFFYQGSLIDEPQSSSNYSCTDIECTDNSTMAIISQRPVNVIGSYAVYHKTGRGNSGRDYRVGKAFHIYRPKAFDANLQETWCTLNISTVTNTMTIRVPQTFLETAVYPVTIDPTFGYTTIGGTSSFDQSPTCTVFTTPEAGNISKITAYVSHAFGDFTLAGAVYTGSAGDAGTKVAEDSGNVTVTTTGWVDLNVSYTMAGSIPLWLCFWANGINAFLKYDTGATNQENQRSGQSFETWPSPFSPDFRLARLPSIYATYTVSAGVVFPAAILNNPVSF